MEAEQKIYSFTFYKLSQELQKRLDIPFINENHILDWEKIIKSMAKKGYWCRISSPFDPEEIGCDKWFAGFTPHLCTGWNGRPDNMMHGETGLIAIMRSALLTVMKEKD